MMEQFLSAADAQRAGQTFQKLARHDISRWALAGGLAMEIHCLRRGCPPAVRRLNDIDFIADSFDAIPESLAKDFQFRHIHPLDPPGKTMVQAIDGESRLRIDVFRAYGEEMARTISLDASSGFRLISFADLTARSARLALDLAENVATPAVYVHDFLRLVDLADAAEIEPVWPDHRKAKHPAAFAEAARLVRELVPARQDLLIGREYAQEAEACRRCRNLAPFEFAEPGVVLAALGYV